MNKKNKILIGCLVLLLALSVGYALFSDTITINGTATAKGEFKLVTTCDTNIGGVFGEYTTHEMGMVIDSKIECDGNAVDASATLGAPGSTKYFRIMVTNAGTIPARLKEIVELNNPDILYCNENDCNSDISNSDSNDDRTNIVHASFYASNTFWDDYETEPVFFELVTHEISDATLDPGETAYFYIQMVWDYKSTTPGEPLTANLKVQMDWQQVTN